MCSLAEVRVQGRACRGAVGASPWMPVYSRTIFSFWHPIKENLYSCMYGSPDTCIVNLSLWLLAASTIFCCLVLSCCGHWKLFFFNFLFKILHMKSIYLSGELKNAYSHIHFPNAHDSQGWTGSKTGSRSSNWPPLPPRHTWRRPKASSHQHCLARRTSTGTWNQEWSHDLDTSTPVECGPTQRVSH